MKTLFSVLLMVVLALGNAQVKTGNGKVVRYENFKSDFVTPRHVDVWLPDNYSEDEKYAVLYMHDGQMLFDPSSTWNKQEWEVDETAGKLIWYKKTKKFIVVGISSIAKIRHSDLFPQKPFESLSKKRQDSILNLNRDKDTPWFGAKVNSDNYLKFIVKEVKPFIDATYATKTDRANTFIAGASMGGLISMYAICEYPEIFGGAACISTHWPGVFDAKKNPIPKAFMAYMKKKLPSPKTHKIYFDYGTETLDASYKPLQQQADKIMKEKGYTSKNWMTKEFVGADHSEKSWKERFQIPLLFLLGV